jgi:hypothetical protein
MWSTPDSADSDFPAELLPRFDKVRREPAFVFWKLGVPGD